MAVLGDAPNAGRTMLEKTLFFLTPAPLFENAHEHGRQGRRVSECWGTEGCVLAAFEEHKPGVGKLFDWWGYMGVLKFDRVAYEYE